MDLRAEHNHLRRAAALEHDREHVHEVVEVERVSRKRLARRGHVREGEAREAPHTAREAERIHHDHRVTTFEVAERAQAAEPGVEQRHAQPGPIERAPGQALEHVDAEAVVAGQQVAEAHHVHAHAQTS
jgi:hypothetical protein